MYSRIGKQREVKQNILNFNGFPQEQAAEDGFEDRLTQKMQRLSLANLRKIFDILCLNRSSVSFEGGRTPSKEVLIDRLAGWLVKPTVRSCVALRVVPVGCLLQVGFVTGQDIKRATCGRVLARLCDVHRLLARRRI